LFDAFVKVRAELEVDRLTIVARKSQSLVVNLHSGAVLCAAQSLFHVQLHHFVFVQLVFPSYWRLVAHCVDVTHCVLADLVLLVSQLVEAIESLNRLLLEKSSAVSVRCIRLDRDLLRSISILRDWSCVVVF